MFSIYTTDGKLACIGPDGRPYEESAPAEASVKDRNARAERMDLTARYEVRPYTKPADAA